MRLRNRRLPPMLIGFVTGVLLGLLPFLLGATLSSLTYIIQLPGAYLSLLIYNFFAGTEGPVQAGWGFIWTIVSIPLIYGLTGCFIGYLVSHFTH